MFVFTYTGLYITLLSYSIDHFSNIKERFNNGAIQRELHLAFMTRTEKSLDLQQLRGMSKSL